MQVVPYNRAAAVAYARKWALKRNPAYYDFENVGGDCTSFVSQCIYTGSGTMNYTPVFGWYYRSSDDRTPSWSGVEYLYNFLINNQGIGPYVRVVSQREAMSGDIVQLGTKDGDFYHSPIITAITPTILVAAHTYDVRDIPLSSYDYDMIRFMHIEGVRIW